ncbi:MAG TPA: cbb3-type cytochrome oxidase assembly protein CcoS [Pseudobdellovibrionaceae bacterium]|nr:cbb3-type cytochrome oxidase assembly protein CcoS [Pseudobdellovibrionaceae bacterium]
MSVLALMIPMSIALAVGFVFAFFWASNKGQFDDLETPAYRIFDEDNERKQQ